jgi:hypothetical protein
MRTLNLRLVGNTPILLHRICRHQEREEIASVGSSNTSFLDEARDKMSKDQDGNPVIPVSWFWDSLRAGCSRITVADKQLSFTRLQSIMRLPTDPLPLRQKNGGIPKCEEVYKSFQHAAPGSKGSIVVVAPLFRDWTAELSVVVSGELFPDNAGATSKTLEKIFLEAGKSGMGLFHPPKKHFGQFRISVK